MIYSSHSQAAHSSLLTMQHVPLNQDFSLLTFFQKIGTIDLLGRVTAQRGGAVFALWSFKNPTGQSPE